MNDAYGMHESGAMIQIYVINKIPYVMLLKSAAVTNAAGQLWGCQTVTKSLVDLAFDDIPGGKTKQFGDREFLKQYFSRKGDGDDPMLVTKDTYPGLESGLKTAIRETQEETHDVISPSIRALRKTWLVDGGFTTPAGQRSKTLVALNVKIATAEDLLAKCMEFIERNFEAFQAYNKWAESNPKTKENESAHWDRRPEFQAMTFVTWSSFRAALATSAQQLDVYQKDKANEPKGVVSRLVDYQGRMYFAVIRSWVVFILQGLLGEIEAAL